MCKNTLLDYYYCKQLILSVTFHIGTIGTTLESHKKFNSQSKQKHKSRGTHMLHLPASHTNPTLFGITHDQNKEADHYLLLIVILYVGFLYKSQSATAGLFLFDILNICKLPRKIQPSTRPKKLFSKTVPDYTQSVIRSSCGQASLVICEQQLC